MTDIIELKNNAYRIVGRQISLWAWQTFELGCSFVLPWLIAGEMSPSKPVEANLAATQQKLTQTQMALELAKAQQVVAQQNGVQQVAAVQPQAGVQVVVNQQVNQQQAQNQAIVPGAQNPSFFSKTKDFIKAIIVNTVDLSLKSAKFLFITLPTGVGRGFYYALSGSLHAIKWVDGTISKGLGFVDEALNTRFKSIPGYRLLTWYPLRLGNWEQTYKQTRNYVLLVNPVWQRVVQPFLKERIFSNEMAKAVTSYLAPYADEGVRLADKGVIGFLSTIYKSASDFGLEAFEKSFVGYWYGSAPVRTPVYNTFVTVSDFFTPVTVSTAQLEAAAERHIESLKSVVPQVWGKITAMNGHVHHYAGHIMTLIATMANDVYRYGNCVANTDRGFMPCTQSAFSHGYTDYLQPFMGYVFNNGLKPVGSFVYQNALNPIMQFLQHNRVTGPIFYFGDCVANGNSGYLMQTGTMLKQATTASLSVNTCPVDTVIVSGFKNCASDGMHYMYVDYAQPFMGATWNFGYSMINGITNGVYNGVATALTGARDGIYNGVAGLAELAAANPGTTVAIGVAIPTVLFAAYGASVAYERVMRPNAQHHVHHGLPANNNL